MTLEPITRNAGARLVTLVTATIDHFEQFALQDKSPTRTTVNDAATTTETRRPESPGDIPGPMLAPTTIAPKRGQTNDPTKQ